MHLIEEVRKRFFKIFFTKRVNASEVVLDIQQLVVRPFSKPLALGATNRGKPGQSNRNYPVVSFLIRGACYLLAATEVACVGPNSKVSSAGSGSRLRTVYVVYHGTLHTGLTVKRTDIPPGHWTANKHYGRSKYIEVGWGDDDGYRKPLTPGIAVKALAGSKRTVLLVDGFSQPILQQYGAPKFEVLAVDLSDTGFTSLCDHIQQTHAVDKRGNPIRLGGGWYRAQGAYSAFNTCNTWIAVGLHKAGCPISPAFCSLPKQLLGRVRPFARPIR